MPFSTNFCQQFAENAARRWRYVACWHKARAQLRATERTQFGELPTAKLERRFTAGWPTRFAGAESVYL
jgi:hypothetical protein